MLLDRMVYEEVEADRGATWQALVVILCFSLAAAVGLGGVEALSAATLVRGVISALVGWLAWASLIYLLGVHLLPDRHTRADVGELLRTTGFAMAPGWWLALGAIPALRVVVLVGVALWLLAAMIVAVRQALDFSSTGRAVAVCAVGWALSLGLAFLIAALTARPVS